ncbi:MAG: hypothetical protein JW795_21850 [Chitinivibrionales bacterium]|nr:hypothetical protein [Chitinivibrionales bacterium]
MDYAIYQNRATVVHRKIMIMLGITLLLLGLQSCSSTRFLASAFCYDKNLLQYHADDRVMMDRGADTNAACIASVLDSSITVVESFFSAPFIKPIIVTVCGSEESFTRRSGGSGLIIGITNWGRVFINPRVFSNRTATAILIHELTHLHTVQRRGMFRTIYTLPAWFTEGIATVASDGAGAESCPDSIAYHWIHEGRHFMSDVGRSSLSPRIWSGKDLSPHVFFRQSSLFVKYLILKDAIAFRQLVLAIEGGRDFKRSFRNAYDDTPSALFDEFRKKAPYTQ